MPGTGKRNCTDEKPVSRVAGAVIVMVWLTSALFCFVWVYNAFME